jgi:transcriptional regulator with XRE-family HTH domain
MASQEYFTLREYRIRLGWSINKLAQEAGIVRQAAANAEAGQPIRAETAKALADALSRGYGREIDVLEIQGLNIL